MVRSVTIDGAVRPGPERLLEDVGVRGHERGVGAQALDERLEPLRRVDRLELGQLGHELLRAAHLVDDAQLVQALVVLLDVQLTDDLEHVAGDPLLGREALDRDGGGLGRGPLHELAGLGSTGGRRVLEAVRPAAVAVERGGRRIELEDPLPEPIGQVVDGRDGLVGHRRRASWRTTQGSPRDGSGVADPRVVTGYRAPLPAARCGAGRADPPCRRLSRRRGGAARRGARRPGPARGAARARRGPGARRPGRSAGGPT